MFATVAQCKHMAIARELYFSDVYLTNEPCILQAHMIQHSLIIYDIVLNAHQQIAVPLHVVCVSIIVYYIGPPCVSALEVK